MVTDLPGCDPGLVIDVIVYPCVSGAGGVVVVALGVVALLVCADGVDGGLFGPQPARARTATAAVAIVADSGVARGMAMNLSSVWALS